MKNLFWMLLLVPALAMAMSLSGDDWKNPLRTKTWTPPATTDTLVGRAQNETISGTKTFSAQLISTLGIGTAPFAITSTTLVPNLYVARSALSDTTTLNANLTGPITSVGNATAVAAQTGTGSIFVMQASPTLTTPNLGTPSTLVGTNITGVAAGLTANVSTKSQTGSSVTTSEIQTPHSQLTLTAAGKQLIETDSENMLINPSFEHSTVATGWTLGTSNTLTVNTTSTNLFSGAQAGALTTSATVVFNFYQDVTPVSGLANTQGEITWAMVVPSGITDGKICSRINGVTSTTNCVSVINNGIYREYSLPIIFGTAGQTAGLAFVTAATYASGTQTVYVDKARVRAGIPTQNLQLDNVYTAQSLTTSGTVTLENKDFISGNCTAANPAVCTFTTGIFTVAPNCWVTATSSASNIVVISAVSSTSVSVQSKNSTTGVDSASVPFTLGCQKEGVDYTSSSSSVYSSSNSNFSGRNDGVMTITAVSSNPTKGTVVTDRIISSRYGNRLKAEYQYQQSGAGAIGSGEYLWTLPAGLSFDSNEVNFKTDAIYSSTLAQSFPKSVVGFGTCAVGAGSGYIGIATLIAYDATRFRALCNYNNGSGSTGQTVVIGSAAYFTLDLALVGYGFKIDAPISGWTNTGSITGSFSGYASIPGYSGYADIFAATISATSALTDNCTTGACYVFQTGTAITAATWVSTGRIDITLARTYSKIICSGSATESGSGARALKITTASLLQGSSKSTLTIQVQNGSGDTNTAGLANIQCIGLY